VYSGDTVGVMLYNINSAHQAGVLLSVKAAYLLLFLSHHNVLSTGDVC
jgi:hypothetical protein